MSFKITIAFYSISNSFFEQAITLYSYEQCAVRIYSKNGLSTSFMIPWLFFSRILIAIYKAAADISEIEKELAVLLSDNSKKEKYVALL